MDRKVILVVDDDDDTVEFFEDVLGGRFQILGVPHGRRGLELAEHGNIDLAVVSRCLPDVDGLDLLATLKQKVPSLPLLFVSVAPTNELIISAFRSGASDFVEKPLDARTILESIDRCLEPVPMPGRFARASRQGAIRRASGRLSWLLRFRDEACARLKAIAAILRSSPRKESGVLSVSKDTESSPNPGPEPMGRMEVAIRQDDTTLHRKKEEGREDEAPALRVYCLGKFSVVLNDVVIERWPSRKGKAIFAHLAINHKRRVYRDVLMDKFWPDSSPDSARNCLNVAIHGLRRLLQQIDPFHEYILFKDECYFINPAVEVWLDVEEFLKVYRLAQSTEREKGIQAALPEYELAASLYRGDFMDEDRYESWPTLEREHLKEIYLFVLDKLSHHYSLDGKPATAISLCERILEKDNCREDVHRRLMRCYYRVGQRHKALKQFRRCTEVLQAELEVEPTRPTMELYEEIKAGDLGVIEEGTQLRDE